LQGKREWEKQGKVVEDESQVRGKGRERRRGKGKREERKVKKGVKLSPLYL